MQLIVQSLQTTLNFNMAGKLRITTFNCQGFKDRMYDYVKEIFKQCDILLLQETWLYNFEHINFANIVPNCQFHCNIWDG